ncbi:DUF4252 domain-containing protein [Nonlabens sp. Ci31]|jgi:hypothetical protein|uniref:DUF4252 domain-containing protein n=1 Tax=Nonlabens sp. Ci31 TaxID=2608253 RepID=UPI0014648AF5|nr:DUF4252 domain-containing protein [Nonlabens sp. Ci31]QJP35596.1 DUF4252 domain-containing protein [Nonlabens sp. Ci31]
MNKIILKIVLLTLAATAALTSCDSDPTLQSYIVDSGEKEGFISTSIPKTILGIDDSKLSEDAQKAYNSVSKVNILVYPKTDKNVVTFEKESAQLNNILKGEKYKTLMTHNQDGMKAKFLYQGDKDSIDEIIVFGTSDDMGMGVARILGKDMNLSGMMKMMKELEKIDIDPAGMKGILETMGIDTKDNVDIDEAAMKEMLESKGIDTSNMAGNKG